MTLTARERTAVRCLCALGEPYRDLLERRMNGLSLCEATIVRKYLSFTDHAWTALLLRGFLKMPMNARRA